MLPWHSPLHVGIDFFWEFPLQASATGGMEEVRYVHSISEAHRLLPSASRWNSIEIDFGLHPISEPYESLPSNYTKSVDFNLVVADKQTFKRFISAFIVVVVALIIGIVLLLRFLPEKHAHVTSSKDLALAVNQALTFFDAQKSGPLPKNHSVNFRSDSGLHDGNSSQGVVDLVGGFYDSGNNVKFGFPTAYTVTLLSWSVIEYRQKFAAINELDHIKDIIRWGSDYLNKIFIPSNSTSSVLYSQVGSTADASAENDINCWQRPEDMEYERPVSRCNKSASDLAGETAAALASASLVFRNEKDYSEKLVQAAEELFAFATVKDNMGIYSADEACGAEAQMFYNSSGYYDELAWAGVWLYFATGNDSYLRNATDMFKSAMDNELATDSGVFYWNNKLPAVAVLLSRLKYFRDPGYQYRETLKTSSDMTDKLMCSYLSLHHNFNITPGGLILLRPTQNGPLQFAATAAFLSKLYNDYLESMKSSGRSCGTQSFSLQMLKRFSSSQVDYILGNNPMKMSYMLGHGDNFPTHVHHRAASIPWDNQHYSCAEGSRWLNSENHNPNVLTGAMVAGPDKDDKFLDMRNASSNTEPSISGNAGLVAALIALHESTSNSSGLKEINQGIDPVGIFVNLH